MIVTCQNCDTSFQLDESRVPLSGIRVRCSRCKESFFLEHPTAGRSQAVDELAGQAANAEGVPPPDATRDLPHSTEVAAAAPVPTSEVINNEDESEWEFNHEPLGALDPPAALHERFGSVAGDGSSGLALAGDDAEAALDEEDLDASTESAFGSVDDFSSLMEEEPAPMEEELALEEGGPADSADLEPLTSESAQAGQYSAQGGSDDLGEPESWDFFSDDALETGGLGEPRAEERGLVERVGASSPTATSREIDGEDDWPQDFYEPESQPPGRAASVLGRLGRTCGWLVACGLAALGLVSGLWSTAESLVASAGVVEFEPLRAESIRARWVDTVRAGRLLVVSGQLRNTGSQAASLSEVLQVALLEEDGSRLELAPAPAGLELSATELRELPAGRQSRARDRTARALARSVIEPGASQPFQALFSEVPDRAARFVLEPAPARLPSAAPDEPVVDPPPPPPATPPPAEESPTPSVANPDTAELTWGE